MKRRVRWISGILAGVLCFSVVSEAEINTLRGQAYAETEDLSAGLETSGGNPTDAKSNSGEGESGKKEAENQVLVRFKKHSVPVKKGSKKKLQKVRKESRVSEQFGTVMNTVNRSSDIATTVSAQEDILSETREKDYVIEDSIDFDDYVVSLISSKTDDTDTMMENLKKHEQVESVTPNRIIDSESADFSSDDPYMEYCYPLADETATNKNDGKNIAARGSIFEGEMKDASMHVTDLWQAKEKKQNTDEIVVAVLDTGIDYTHEELSSHIWNNPGDIGLLGRHGYDFSANDEDPMDENGHGTHCAGIIAAQADNKKGISGVAGTFADDGNLKLMALKIFDKEGTESTEFAALGAFRYILTAVENGVNVRIISNSWGADQSGGYGNLFDEIIRSLGEKGVLSIFAAGNSGKDLDAMDSSPASSTVDSMVCVGSINERGDKAGYSNYGKSQVDFFAPGSNIFSSVSYDNYLPVTYSKEQLEKTTQVYGIFDGDSITPGTADAEVSAFQTPVILNQDGKEITEGVKLSVSEERYKNLKTKKSLKVEISEVKKDDTYYVYFPYQSETKADGKNVYVTASVGMPYDLQEEEKGVFGVADMLRYEDGSVRRPLVPALTYKGSSADYNLYDFSIISPFSYTDVKAASSHGIAVLYKATKTAPATLYIDGLGVSKAGVESSLFGKYAFLSGTSMACPNAAGAAALLLLCYSGTLEKRTKEGTKALKELLLSSVRKSDKLKGLCVSGGFLDLSKAASEDFSPVLSSANVNVSADTITLTGANFGKEKGNIICTHLLHETDISISAEEILSWDTGKIVLKDSKKADGSYKFRGNYVSFSVQTADKREGDSSFYLSFGINSFDKISKFPVTDREEEVYAGLISVGEKVYGVTGIGSVFQIHTGTGDRNLLLSVNHALSEVAEEGLLEALGLDYYEWNHDFLASVIGNPVCIEGKMYEWISIKASDREFYMGLMTDLTEKNPDWTITALENIPKKTDYKNIPKNFTTEKVSLCEYKGKIYSIGGYEDNKDGKGSMLIYVFDPAKMKWTLAKEAWTEKVYGFHLEESNGRLYAFLGSAEKKDTAGFQQPDRRIFCYDGKSWKTLKTELPEFIKTVTDSSGRIAVNVATAVTNNGIVVTGACTDGYGDTFLIDTRENDDVSLKALDISYWAGLNTGEYKLGTEAVFSDEKGEKKEGILLLSDDVEDNISAYSVYRADTSGEGSAYYQISVKTKGTGKGTVRWLERIKKYGDYKETFTVSPNQNSVVTSVLANGTRLKAIAKNTYRFVPKKDTKIVVTFSIKQKASRATLKKKKKSLRRGGTYRISLLKKHGQKVRFSISKKTKKKGIRINAKGKITVKKRAKPGTYLIKVVVLKNSKYKGKTLKFTLIVKK